MVITIAECVLPGHPDKLCDRIADGLVDAALECDQEALVGIEVALHRDHVFIDGRIACPGAEEIDAEKIVRSVFTESGYGTIFPPEPKQLKILTDLCLGDFREEERAIRVISDDQNIVTGYAEFRPSTNHLPPAQYVARIIAQALDEERREVPELFGPDGKVLVVLQDGQIIKAISLSLQHHDRVGTIDVVNAAKQALKRAKQHLSDIQYYESGSQRMEVIVNGAGDFAVGGPEGDNGLSGKKLVVDAYGPHVPIGGGALCGKDPHKIDRAMALRARQIAKHLVLAGITKKALVTLAFAPGDKEPRWRMIQLADRLAEDEFTERWLSGYDLTLEGTFRDLQLNTIRWRDTAAWGYFWNPELPWERWNIGKV